MMHAMNNLALIIGWCVMIAWSLVILGLFVVFLRRRAELAKHTLELQRRTAETLARLEEEARTRPRFRTLDEITVEEFLQTLRRTNTDE